MAVIYFLDMLGVHLLMSLCKFKMSNTLLISSAAMIVSTGGAFGFGSTSQARSSFITDF